MFGGKEKPSKEEWLKEAERAYNAVFAERDRASQGQRQRMMTFSEIEAEAVQEGNQLARWLIEGKIASEAATSNCQEEPCTCPRCGAVAKRKREGKEKREIQSRPGVISFDRFEYYCRACRRSFFSSGPRSESQG